MLEQQLGTDIMGGLDSPDAQLNPALNYANMVYLGQMRECFESSRIISDNMRKHVVTVGNSFQTPLAVDEYGYVELPSDFEFLVSGVEATISNPEDCDDEASLDFRQVEWLESDIFDSRISGGSKGLNYPTLSFPIGRIETYLDSSIAYPRIRTAPVGLSTLTLTYMRTPTTPVWGYTYDDSGLPVYDPTTSVDIEWPDTAIVNDFEFGGVKYPSFLNLCVKWLSKGVRSDWGIQTATV
jgi:hypothetical protein